MAGGGVLAGAVITAYDSLVEALSDASAEAGIGFVEWTKPISSRFRVNERDTALVEFDAYLHLAEWKAGKEKISILVHVYEIIRRSDRTIVKSTVNLAYYRIEGHASRHLHSIHFDYDGAQDCHPVFHAQLCADTIQLSLEDADDLSFQYGAVDSTPTCFKDARIPTSDMTLPSVLLCVAADHLERAFFAPFLESVRALQDKMPLPAFAQTQASIASAPGHLRSSHWFAHMLT